MLRNKPHMLKRVLIIACIYIAPFKGPFEGVECGDVANLRRGWGLPHCTVGSVPEGSQVGAGDGEQARV